METNYKVGQLVYTLLDGDKPIAIRVREIRIRVTANNTEVFYMLKIAGQEVVHTDEQLFGSEEDVKIFLREKVSAQLEAIEALTIQEEKNDK